MANAPPPAIVRPVKTKLDPDWHKARVAARILLKARTRPLNARDRRLARRFAADKGVTNRLVEQAVSTVHPQHRIRDYVFTRPLVVSHD